LGRFVVTRTAKLLFALGGCGARFEGEEREEREGEREGESSRVREFERERKRREYTYVCLTIHVLPSHVCVLWRFSMFVCVRV
jgi:hypothetical protein